MWKIWKYDAVLVSLKSPGAASWLKNRWADSPNLLSQPPSISNLMVTQTNYDSQWIRDFYCTIFLQNFSLSYYLGISEILKKDSLAMSSWEK